ncbi:MAG: hypoxanthine phosphoribosyltransferase [Polyangiaceae bacterium]|nr:hypoxanthine phosphoribosyltransferase [Polyangiaceae bacterium]
MDPNEPRIRTLITEGQITARIRELGAEITRDYTGRHLVLLCVLKGSFMFTADLARAISLPMRIEFLGLRSYGDGTRSTGVVQITQDLTQPIAGEDVIVVEDIVDTGLTLNYLLDLLRARGPRSVRVCTLLHKPARTKQPIRIDYLGFTVEDQFVVGYGLDCGQRYRNLGYVGVVE